MSKSSEQQQHVKDTTFVDSEGGGGNDEPAPPPPTSLSHQANNSDSNSNSNSGGGGGGEDGASRGITKPAAVVRAVTHDGVTPSFSNNNDNQQQQQQQHQHSDGEQDDEGGSGLKKSESSDKIGTMGPGAPKKLKKIGKPPSRPRLSIDALGPLIVDRTELQSPIKLEHEIPEVARIVVASIQVDLEKKREASHRNLAALANADVSIPPSSNGGLAAANPPATSAPAAAVALDTNSPPTHAPATPSFITQVTQPSAPVQRPDIAAAVKKAAADSSTATAVTTSQAQSTNIPTAAPTTTPQSTQQPQPSSEPAKTQPSPPKPSLLHRLFPCFCMPSSSSPKSATNAVPMSDLSHSTTTSSKKSSTTTTTAPAAGTAVPVIMEEGKLLPPAENPTGLLKKCLVLDLDETLLHSSFKPVAKSDFTIPVEIDGIVHTVYVLKRPFVEQFLDAVALQYELVVFTASLAKYADPVLDILDPKRLIKHRLFRESCTHLKGNYIKDLALLGRDLATTIIIDNSPTCYMLQPANAVPITSWFDDPEDRELVDLIPFLNDLNMVDDVREVLSASMGTPQSIPGSISSPASSPPANSNSPITQVPR